MSTDRVMPHSTVLRDPVSGEYVVVVEGSDAPDWYDVQSGTTRSSESDSESDGDDDDGGERATPPAKSGPNAGAAKWAAYANAVGVDVPDGTKQGEIVALLEAAGKPTE